MRTGWLWVVVIVVGLWGLSGVGRARAQAPLGDMIGAGDTTVSAFADLAFWTGSEGPIDVTVISPLVGGSVGAGPIELALTWGFVHTSASGEVAGEEVGAADETAGGNPYLSGHYVGESGPVAYRVGLGLAPPLAGNVAVLGAPLRGLWNAWLWLPDTLAVVPSVGLAIRGVPLVDIAGDLQLGVLVPTEDGDTEVIGQLGGEIAASAGLFGAGFRVQGVWLLTEDLDDAFQLSIEPRIELRAGPGVVALRLLMNLDEPNGFAFDDGGVWALRLTAGVGI